jgi:hypothetical protein
MRSPLGGLATGMGAGAIAGLGKEYFLNDDKEEDPEYLNNAIWGAAMGAVPGLTLGTGLKLKDAINKYHANQVARRNLTMQEVGEMSLEDIEKLHPQDVALMFTRNGFTPDTTPLKTPQQDDVAEIRSQIKNKINALKEDDADFRKQQEPRIQKLRTSIFNPDRSSIADPLPDRSSIFEPQRSSIFDR